MSISSASVRRDRPLRASLFCVCSVISSEYNRRSLVKLSSQLRKAAITSGSASTSLLTESLAYLTTSKCRNISASSEHNTPISLLAVYSSSNSDKALAVSPAATASNSAKIGALPTTPSASDAFSRSMPVLPTNSSSMDSASRIAPVARKAIKRSASSVMPMLSSFEIYRSRGSISSGEMR